MSRATHRLQETDIRHMHAPLPLTRELVLVGGGHAHAIVLRRWGMSPLPGARLTVINPGPTAPYTGMLPGFVAGHYHRDDIEIDLVRLARFAGARLVLGHADAIDRERHRINVAGRGEIAYDVASLDIGISSDLPNLPGFAEHAVAAKPLDAYARAWSAFRADVAASRKPPEIAVLGAGVGGVELALAMAHALRMDGHLPRLSAIDKARTLSGLRPRARRRLCAELEALGIALVEHSEAVSVARDSIVLADGREIPSAFTVSIAGARPQAWLADTGLALSRGFVDVDARLRSSTDSAIYAVGDCAHFVASPRPKAGVFAVRAAPVLLDNLRAEISGERPRRIFRPQSDYLKLVSLGRKSALAEKWGFQLGGPWLWRWKDRIDRRFMDRLARLPRMSAAPIPRRAADGLRQEMRDGAPPCGGCGAKVGGNALSRVLADLPVPNRDDILGGPGDDAAVLKTNDAAMVVSADHLRAFVEDPWTMARIAAIHAMGDIWAMGAEPQSALATVILPRMTERMQEAWLSEIMSAAAETFADEGAAVVGGHTTLGSELTIGFAVTGLTESAPIAQSGGRPGDALILSRPIGSGTILAAEMRGEAKGPWVADCLAEMSRSQGAAARALAKARAMTDVTGFGLVAHLLSICDASATGAELVLADIPIYEGAEALAAQGVRSTLHPVNREASGSISLPDAPEAELLFDPQTAGGLLAAIAPEEAAVALAKLRSAGFAAARIGQLVDGPPLIKVRR